MTRTTLKGLLTLALPALLCGSMATMARAEMLMIDFNSLTQDLGPHLEPGYQAYNAGHEVASEFVTVSYPAFGTTVSLTPTWPGTTDNRVQQMIDRTTSGPPVADFDANYIGTKLDLVTDWIGLDTRPANGGNGPDAPTTMDLTLEGLPAGQYYYRAYHHDTEYMNAPFTMTLTDADGTVPIGRFEMTGSSEAATNPNPINPGPGNDPAVLPSTVIFPFRSNGSLVVIEYQATEGANVHESVPGVNGIEISDQPILPATPLLEVDRETGAMTFVNETADAIELLGYSVQSDVGALDPAQWKPIAGNYDAPPSGDGSVDPDDPWTRLTAASSRGDLSEAELVGGDGATIASGQSIVLSQPGAGPWIQNPSEDLRMETLQLDGAVQSLVRVRFVGNGGQPLTAGDFNFDGVIDVDDYPIFLAGLQADLTSLSPAEAYQMGDMNGDLANNHADILLFKAAFDGANGVGAFDAMITAVPEPTSLVLLVLGGAAVLCFARRSWVPARAAAYAGHGNDRRHLDLRMVQERAAARSSHLAIAFGIALLGNLLVAGSVSAALITYVDAISANDPLGRAANTTLVDGSPFLPTEDNAADDLWRIRRFANPTDPDGGTIFATNENGDENAPGLVTTVDGLVPNADYDMFAYLWSDPGNWRLKASLTQIPPLPDNPSLSFSKNGTATSTQAPLAVAEDFQGVPLLAEGNRLMYQASLGTTMANDAGEILVYIDDQEAGGDRTWYDGIGYREKLDPLTLEVNIDTGMTQILNESGNDFEINFYEILSLSGSLDVTNWDSLDDQKLDATGDGGPLDGWDEAGGSRAEVLSELNFLGSSVLADQGALSLGSAFRQATGQEDLEFNFSLSDGSLLPGIVEYVEGGVILGDVNLDSVVNGLDVDPFVGVLLNGPFQAEADMNLDGVVNGLDVDPFVAAVVGGGLQAVPEPSTLALVGLAGLAMVLRISRGGRSMKSSAYLSLLAAGLLVALVGSTSQANSTLDRSYLFGDNTGVSAQNENATAGQKIGSGAGGVTFDTVSESNNPGNDNDAQNLSPSATAGPTYVSVGQGPFLRTADDGDPTPPAAGDLGAQFSGSGEYLRGARLGLPETAAGSLGYGDVVGGAVWNPNDYTGISNRGYQLWVYPTSNAAAQSVVMDTNQHGVRISAAGNWSMHYPGGTDVESTIPVATDQWSHVMLVRPFGAAGGGRLYVDGIVVAANGVGYTGDDNASLVLGSNTGTDADGNFNGGTEEFFSGLMDNLEMFVLGTSTGDNPEDFGTFDPQTDNQFIAGAMVGVPDGDVDMDGSLDPVADVDAFVAGWLNLNEVNGIQVGDLGSRAAGDLNFDGITDLSDAFVLHEALSAAGGGLDFSALTAAVPEPSTLVLLILAAVVGLLWRRR